MSEFCFDGVNFCQVLAIMEERGFFRKISWWSAMKVQKRASHVSHHGPFFSSDILRT